MKGFVVTNCTDVSLLEIDELIKEKGTASEKIVIFNSTQEQLCDLCYHGRSFSRVCELLCDFEFNDVDDISEKLKINGFSAESFSVVCIREGKHDFESKDVEKLVGDKIDCKVDLKNPQKILLAFVRGNKFYLGIDYSGRDLGKRSYKIFPHPASIRGDTGYSLLRLSGYDGKGVVVDPFCGSGTILIEAALFSSGKSVHFFDKDKFAFTRFIYHEFKDEVKEAKDIFGMDFSQNAVVAARKNAKIAGVEKYIEFSNASIDWLDTKFSEKSVDFIVTDPPAFSRRKNNDKVKKSYEELFDHAKYVLNKRNIIIITKNPAEIKEAAEKEGFKLARELRIASNVVLIFK